MKVKELIEKLKEYDENLEICLQVEECTAKIECIKYETKDNYSYDKNGHIIEYEGWNECLTLSDDFLYNDKDEDE